MENSIIHRSILRSIYIRGRGCCRNLGGRVCSNSAGGTYNTGPCFPFLLTIRRCCFMCHTIRHCVSFGDVSGGWTRRGFYLAETKGALYFLSEPRYIHHHAAAAASSDRKKKKNSTRSLKEKLCYLERDKKRSIEDSARCGRKHRSHLPDFLQLFLGAFRPARHLQLQQVPLQSIELCW